ncbi:MAG: hypothetical protein ACHRHE_24195 [Tepidisphaerales bacterium]
MSDPNNDNSSDRWDAAVSRRLGQLGGMPVDTSGMESLLRSRTGGEQPRLRVWLRPMRIAASLLLAIGALAAVVVWVDRGAHASASEMAQLHYDLVATMTPVDSIDAANDLLSATASGGPGFAAVPAEHRHACCVKNIKDARVACVLMKSDNAYITMAVANADAVKMPHGQVVVKDGLTFHVQTIGKVHMVTLQRAGRHVCLMSELPAERLIELGTKLRF